MNRMTCVALLLGTILLVAACTGDYEVGTTGDAPAAAPSEPGDAAAKTPEGDTPATRPAPGTRKAPAPASASQSTPRPQRAILLSPNVALAQTLPEGTAMGFSVDYQYMVGTPNPSSLYLWVIESEKRPPYKQFVQLGRRGTLEGFFPGVRPEHAPFKTHIEDTQGNRLSASVPIKYP
jgi:hypothetical protein